MLDDALAEQEKSPSLAALIQMANDLAGSNGLENIPNDHPIYTIMYDLGGPPFYSTYDMPKTRNDKPQWLRGMMGGRLRSCFRRGYSTAWSHGRAVKAEEFVNLNSYALVSRKK